MKKLIRNVTIFSLFLILISCEERILDKKPLDIISDAQVWNDPNLIEAYVTNLYNRARLDGIYRDFIWWPYYAPCREVVLTDEARMSYNWTDEVAVWNKGVLDGSGGMFDYWDYNYIRYLNEFLQNVETGNVSDDVRTIRSAEVRFLRAFTYFEMAKRYGGVPLITEPQDISQGDALFVERDLEKDIWEFILSECDAITNSLPDSYPGIDKGRISKYAVLALKSRAMLYAASEAKYGEVQLNGLAGVPANDANGYWQESYNASNAIIQSGIFQLYNNYPEDKAKNYQMLFLEKDNQEIILAKKFISVIKGHSHDLFNSPESFKVGWGNQINVTMEMVNDYDMIDGSSGVIDWANIRGIPSVILKDKDPRFHASIFYHGQPWQGDSVVLYWGILADTDGDGQKEKLTSGSQSYNGMPHIGKDANGEDATKTGFILKKFLDEERVLAQGGESDQDWINFRYGEILLNFAEAAFELGKPGEALDAINQIRDRAGIAELSSITLNQIRHERKIELAFETHRWWDLRRWRLSMTALNGDFHGVYPIYDYELQDYVFEVFNCDGYTRGFKPEHYHMPLGNSLIDNNPNLVENPGY